MKFVVNRDHLLKGLQQIQSVVEKKNTVQILSNVLCTVSKDRLSLSATDLEVGMKVSFPVHASDEGKLTLSAKNFTDIIKELPEGAEVQVSRKSNDWAEVISGKSRFSVVSLSADEFPALPDFENKSYQDARSETLSDMIDKTSFAISMDATRYILNGVYFETLENNLMRMTALDGHRLSFIDQEVFLKAPDMKRGVIIPKKGLGELKKLLEESGETVGLAFEKGMLFARSGDTYLYVRLIEGEYPNYKHPNNADKSAKIGRDAFNAALRRVSLLAHEKSKSVKFHFSQGSLAITSSNPDVGEAREELDVSYAGEPTEISFNAKYILDCLPVIHSDELEFSFKDRLSPGILQGVNQRNHTYVIMPMRV